MDLTVLIITKNAADTLARTLKSIKDLHSKVVVVDDYSLDNTIEIAQAYDCKIVRNHCYDFGAQRAFALQQVDTQWTLVLDSDEVLTSSNRKEIIDAVQKNVKNGYYLHFRNHLFGKKLLHGELHKKLVLFQTNKASSGEKYIHEQYNVDGNIGTLPSEVLHYSYRSIPQVISKFFDYSVRQAKQFKKEKKQFGVRELLLNPLHMFYARTIIDMGYKDGFARIILDALFAKMEFFSYALIPFVKSKKRVSIDCGSYYVSGIVHGGIDRVIQGIYSNKDKSADYYWFGFNSKSTHRLPTLFYSQVWLPLAAIFNRCDVFLGVGGTIPFLLRFFPIKKTLFLYDFGFFETPEKYVLSAGKLQSQTNSSIVCANKIIVLHEEIYKEFEKRYPNFIYKVGVIQSGADHLQKVKEVPVFIQPKKPLILFVGVVKPVKRIEKLLSVVGDTYTVIAGPQEEEYKKTLQVGETQNIHYINNFNDGQLKWLYSKADVMVYTSEREGFCYPVLEALLEGLPVIAFDLPIFQEYKKYFPHLTLVSTEKEMKSELAKNNFKKTRNNTTHPYRWETFSRKLLSLNNFEASQPARLTEAKCAFIVVLYKTPEEEKKRLEKEIYNIGVKNTAIYWVDNSANGKGYAAGINEGIRSGLANACDYFFVLNPDLSLKDISSDTLLSVSKLYDVWGYAMKQGKDIFYGGEIDKWRLSGGLVTTKPHNRFICVDFVSGSVMGFTKEVVQTIGLWDESYFMYYEDVDYCVRARKAGFSVGIDSMVQYDHFEVSQLNKKKEQWIAKSRWKFFWKYSNWLQKIREIVRLPKTLKGV
jgi:GT2 family glycosyltransferase/glycosyltransferase involved in cell wall biosynthesis